MLLFILMMTIVIYISVIIFVISMAVRAGKHGKFLWIFIILCFPLIGATVYFFCEERHDYAKMPKENNTQ